MLRERFEQELTRPLEYWSGKSKREVHELLGRYVAAMVGFAQNNPHHCYDLFQHILHTVDALPEDASALLRTAAFFHDIGKPEVAREKKGHLVFYGHARRSVIISTPILRQMGYEEEEVKEITFYIEHHDDFIPWYLTEEISNIDPKYAIEITEENVRRYKVRFAEAVMKAGIKRTVDELLENLMALCYADSSAQAEEVYFEGVLSDSRKHKQEKIIRIKKFAE